VLRYDKRGVGKSTGNPDTANDDGSGRRRASGAGVPESRKEIDGSKIGLIGHSEGAIIAPYWPRTSKM